MALADQVVVMSERREAAAVSGLRRRPPQGHHDPARCDHPQTASVPSGAVDPPLLTWGLMGPGKGIERVIDAMGSLGDLPAAAVSGCRPDAPEGAGRRGRGIPRGPDGTGARVAA